MDDLEELGATIRYVYKIIPAIALSLPAASVDEVIEELEGNVRIEGVESDIVVQTNLDPNDPQFPNLWGLHNTGQAGGTLDADIDAPEAWDITTGNSGTILAVVDTGVDINHPDLAVNIWSNLAEVNGIPGIDDDNNGYIDDVNGWNFFDNVPWVVFSADEDSHGTHVAGTIAADGNNGTGVVGVNWNAQIMVLKFLGPGGSGYTSDAIAAIEYAMNNGAEVINASWGCQESPSVPNCFSQALKDAIQAYNRVFVAAAGNNGTDNDGVFSHYPSSYNSPNIIAVAATDRNDALASFSNVGTASVDLGGPGVSILSTLPLNNYGYGSGTSMATPHVTGVAALLLALDPTLSPAEVKGLILDNADPVSSLAGITVTGGRLNAANAVGAVSPPIADTTPPVISSIAANPLSNSAIITWTTDEPATSLVDLGLTAAYGSVVSDPLLVTSHSLTLTGLTAPTLYHYQVTSVDSAGNPASSGDFTFTTAAPTLVSIAVTPANPSVVIGATQQFAATGTYSDTTTADITGDVTWASTLTTVATIPAGGLATAVDVGTTTISATLGSVFGSTTLSVTPVPDTTPPVISGVTAAPTSNSATITWSTNEPGTSQVDYGLSASYGTVVSDPALATSHSLTLTGLTAPTLYHYQVTSVDSAGNPASSGDFTFTTAAPTLVSIAVTPANPSVVIGATQQFAATGTYSDTTTADITGDVTWASTLTTVATIPAGGLATAVDVGTTTISATLGSVFGSTTLSVNLAFLVESPSNLTASRGEGKIKLAWDLSSTPGANSHNIYRNTTAGGPYTLVAAGVTDSKYRDKSVIPEVTYYYVVTALLDGQESAYSNEAYAAAEPD